MDPKRDEFLNTAAALGTSARAAAQNDLPIRRAEAREQLRAALVLEGSLDIDDVESRVRALVERYQADGVTAAQLRATLREDAAELRELSRLAHGGAAAMTPLLACTSSTPPRATRRETRSRPTPARDEGSGGEEPPGASAHVLVMGEIDEALGAAGTGRGFAELSAAGIVRADVESARHGDGGVHA